MLSRMSLIAVWAFFFFGARPCSLGNHRRHSSPSVLTSTILQQPMAQHQESTG